MVKNTMKFHKQVIATGLAFVLAPFVGVEAQLTIDNFSVPTPTQTATDGGGGFDTSTESGLGANTISGERTITALRTGGSGTLQSRVAQGAGTFNVDAGSGTQGVGTIEWLIGTPADLTTGGATAFQFVITNNDQGATIEAEVEDSNSFTSTLNSGFISGAATEPELFTAFFTSFTGSADFTDVTRIKFTVTNASDTDFAMQAILTVEPQDFGDAPESGTSPNGSGTNAYCTTLANDGPRHIISLDGAGDVIGPLLGQSANNVDPEKDATTDSTATGDDNEQNAIGPIDDEDGISNVNIIAASASSFDLHVTGATGKVNAWIDFNGDGDFADAGEQILTNDSRAIGTHTIAFTAPLGAHRGPTFMRLRISSADLVGSDTFKTTTTPAADGEVEDHQITIQAFEYGDLPNTFKTDSASLGAVHPFVASDAKLGSLRDSEGDGNPSVGANGDDTDGLDDEDGVSGIPVVVTPSPSDATITVTVTEQDAKIAAWVDLNQDGVFTDGTEQFIPDNTIQAVGSTNYTLPLSTGSFSTGATTGDKIYLRFRVVNNAVGHNIVEPDNSFFHNGILPITSGEVEDYVITVVANLQDWGDAPDTYITTTGPRHNIGTGDPQFGAERDAEGAGQPNATATGDDSTGSPDDEDGVDFAGVGTINIGSTISLPITVGGATGDINAFIDFNGDGDFLDAGEQVLTNVSQGVGTTNHSISIPPTATAGTTYARFRISTAGGDLADTGTAADGEIEDYLITLTENLDFGDAPESGTSGNGTGTNNYGTTLANNGPRHTITGPRLGVEEDSENDGAPSSAADGDDTTGSPDDEDGVVFPACLDAGTTISLPITVSGASGKVSVWIDLNGDGDFTDIGEQVLANVVQAVGLTNHNVAIPTSATPGSSFARVRIVATTDANLTSPLGAANSGEVEDYTVTICKDFGDAPDSYCTVLASDGARHDNTGPFLGTLRDTETDAAAVGAGAVADGDDNAGSDDEDGVSFSPAAGFDLNTATSNSITFTIGNGPADVEVFIDWNKDGDFSDAGERLDFDGRATGVHNESITIPGGTTVGNTYVRVRVYTVGTSLDSEKGSSPAGEVEDYRITISDTTLVDLLSFDAVVSDAGQVAVNWVTGAEIDTAGFNLLRGQLDESSAAANYETVKLNSQLIPSQGTSVEGASYEYLDTPGYGTFYYQLEDIEISGKVGLHPFREVTILPTLEIGLDEASRVNINYVVLPGWNYEVEYKSLADEDADWQALPDAPHNGGVISDEVGTETSDRLYRLKASPQE